MKQWIPSFQRMVPTLSSIRTSAGPFLSIHLIFSVTHIIRYLECLFQLVLSMKTAYKLFHWMMQCLFAYGFSSCSLSPSLRPSSSRSLPLSLTPLLRCDPAVHPIHHSATLPVQNNYLFHVLLVENKSILLPINLSFGMGSHTSVVGAAKKIPISTVPGCVFVCEGLWAWVRASAGVCLFVWGFFYIREGEKKREQSNGGK